MRSNKRIKYHYEFEESSYYSKLLATIGIGLFILTILSALILSSPSVSADTSATNDVEITVPISCNLASSTTTAHTATIDAGTYRNDIGESTITATCNDSEGFAIYAIGYSNEEYGNNTLINTTNSTQTIATGTATSGATSNWAMKLTAVDGTYTPTIVGSTLDSEKEQSTPDFSNYIDIPSTYTKVAYRNSNTDQSTGANFKSTYAAYIAPTQYAGTYEGKVKYTLVHPASEAAPPSRPVEQRIQVTYNSGEDGYFGDDTSVHNNVVVYDTVCDSREKEYYVSKTSNLDDEGNQLSALSNDESIEDDFEIPGASKLKVVLNYDLSFNEENPYNDEYSDYEFGDIYVYNPNTDTSTHYYGTGTNTIYIDGNSVSMGIYVDSSVTIDEDHDYGYYARVYPLNENDEEYTFQERFDCTANVVSGEYADPHKLDNSGWLCYWSPSSAIAMPGSLNFDIGAERFRYGGDSLYIIPSLARLNTITTLTLQAGYCL